MAILTNKYIQLLFISVFLLGSVPAIGEPIILNSPNGKVSVKISAESDLAFSVSLDEMVIIPRVNASMNLGNGDIIGKNCTLLDQVKNTVNNTIKPIVPIKNASINNHYNQLLLKFKNDFAVIFRAYDDAVAYRFLTYRNGTITIVDEQCDIKLKTDDKAWFSYLDDLTDSVSYRWMVNYEQEYQKDGLDNYRKKNTTTLPLLVESDSGIKCLITESDLRDYPGLYLEKSKNATLRSVFPPKVKKDGYIKHMGDSFLYPIDVFDYIAKTDGNRAFPWRVFAFARNDKDLLNNEVVYKLAEQNRLKSYDWIEPGQVIWDWWNDWNISHVDFKAGKNTETYKYYIDFASKNKIPYFMLDAGWSPIRNLLQVNSGIDMEEIFNYAKKKNVGIFLWANWSTLNRQMDSALNLFQKWGVKGIKIDVINRDDQDVVNFYWRIAEEAAKRKMMLNFHAAYKPTGLNRTYPNVVNYEAVAGLEYDKGFGDRANPDMAVTIPFIRMFTGPLDYTPGAMRNSIKKTFSLNFSMPMSQGTRTQQLAMYVLFDAPIQMISDNPTTYTQEQESLDFITSVPTVWDQTIPLQSKIGEYVSIARKKKNEYFLGAMTNWESRDLEVDFSFLPEGVWKLRVFEDGVNADKVATDYKVEVITITNKDKRTFHLAPGGGIAGRIYK